MVLEQILHQRLVADIALYEGVDSTFSDAVKIFQAASVREQVQVKDEYTRMVVPDVMDEIRTDEPSLRRSLECDRISR